MANRSTKKSTITRTFALGPVTDEQKKHFTAVLCSMLNLANAKFLQGMTGIGLDILARGPIWDMGIDYRCGTGHGVSYLMSVHEGPNSFRWHKSPTRAEDTVQEPGMVTTDEPGVYIEGSHGIRTENELVCRKLEENVSHRPPFRRSVRAMSETAARRRPVRRTRRAASSASRS